MFRRPAPDLFPIVSHFRFETYYVRSADQFQARGLPGRRFVGHFFVASAFARSTLNSWTFRGKDVSASSSTNGFCVFTRPPTRYRQAATDVASAYVVVLGHSEIIGGIQGPRYTIVKAFKFAPPERAATVVAKFETRMPMVSVGTRRRFQLKEHEFEPSISRHVTPFF